MSRILQVPHFLKIFFGLFAPSLIGQRRIGEEMGTERGNDLRQRAAGWNQTCCSEDTAPVQTEPATRALQVSHFMAGSSTDKGL